MPAPARNDPAPQLEAPLTTSKIVVAVVTGVAGLACGGLLLYDLIQGIHGPVPIIETLAATVALSTCFKIGPGTMRRAAAGSVEVAAVVIACLTFFATSAGRTASDPTAVHSGGAFPSTITPTTRAPRCPVPAGSPPLGAATSPEPSDRTSGGLGEATIDGVESGDGKAGIGPGMVVCVTILRPPALDRQLWLVVRLNPREGLDHRLYFPKEEITLAAGSYKLTIHARCATQKTRAGIGNLMTLMIISADVAASRSLRQNYDADQACDSQFDNNPVRRHLPAGSKVISNQGNVTRTR